MSEHTPGPWVRSDVLGMNGMYHIFIKTKAIHTDWTGNETQKIIARVDGIASEMTEKEVIANADLMIAGHDLLEALRDAEDALKGMIYNFEHETGENIDADMNPIMEKIEQVIAKVKGD